MGSLYSQLTVERRIFIEVLLRRGALVRLPCTPMPNPSLKRSANGRPPGPGLRYAVHFLSPGPGVLPLSPA